VSIEQAMSHGMTQEPTLQWMWADTLFPALARRNPLRWSIPATFAEAASEMECEGERTRGVVLRIIPPGLDGGDHGRESAGIEYWLPGLRSGGSFKREHQFESLPAALAWVRREAAHFEGRGPAHTTAEQAGARQQLVAEDRGLQVRTGSWDDLLCATGVEGSENVPWIRRLETGVRDGVHHLKSARDALERLAPRVLDGLNTLMTSSQTEILLGKDGSAALDHIISIYKKELHTSLAEVSHTHLAKGLVALGCLQQVMYVRYGARGMLKDISAGGGSASWSGDLAEGQWESKEVQIQALRRWARIAGMAYGRAHDQLLGSASRSATDLLDGNEAALIREMGLGSVEDILASQWGSEGPHEPGFVLFADRAFTHARAPHGHLILAIRGTMSASDALTDLRCDEGVLKLSGTRHSERSGSRDEKDSWTGSQGSRVHTGI
jgi:hypothetical protein